MAFPGMENILELYIEISESSIQFQTLTRYHPRSINSWVTHNFHKNILQLSRWQIVNDR